MSLKTPMYDSHIKLNAKMVEFANYYLPIQFTSILKEHESVRNNVGVFDVSHMGQILIEGDAVKFLDYLLCNKISNIKPGRMKYSPMLNKSGGIVDDVLVYCFNENKCMLVVNAINKDKDFQWITQNAIYNIKLTDLSDKIAQIALQGPNSKEILTKLVSEEELPKKYYSFKDEVEILNNKVLVSRNGYTGEDGYEIYGEGKAINNIFNKLIEYGVVPCGLGSRDTLRLEAAMPLYGHEMNDDITPLDTALEFFCKLDKEVDFIGKENLKDKNKTRVGLKILDRGILRENMKVYFDDKDIGYTTSGTFLPTLKASYAMAIIDKDKSSVGQVLEVEVRNKKVKVEVVSLPFYKREK